MTNNEARYFAGAIVRFLHDQCIERSMCGDVDDTIESLEVAIQCLQTAFRLPASVSSSVANVDNWDDAHPLAGTDAFAMFRHHNDATDVSVERQQHADRLKSTGNRLMAEQKFYEALQAYSRAITVDPTNPVIYCNRAAAHSRLGDYAHAVDDCKLALCYDSGYGKAYGRMGNAYAQLHEPALALEAYRNALRLDPANADYRHNATVTETQLAVNMAEPNRSNAAGLSSDILNISNLALNNPELMGFAQRVLADPMVHDIVANIRQDGGMESLLEVGRQMVQHMSTENPDLLQDLASRLVDGCAEQANEQQEASVKPPKTDDK